MSECLRPQASSRAAHCRSRRAVEGEGTEFPESFFPPSLVRMRAVGQSRGKYHARKARGSFSKYLAIDCRDMLGLR